MFLCKIINSYFMYRKNIVFHGIRNVDPTIFYIRWTAKPSVGPYSFPLQADFWIRKISRAKIRYAQIAGIDQCQQQTFQRMQPSQNLFRGEISGAIAGGGGIRLINVGITLPPFDQGFFAGVFQQGIEFPGRIRFLHFYRTPRLPL
ncbi:MAG: hypothetical protein WD708_03205 [Kiritimatiellia bacterium]